MAHPTRIAIALAEKREVSRQWVAFRVRAQHEEAMRELFKAEKKSRSKRKLERGKAESKDPQTAKHSSKVRTASGPTHSPVAVEHAAPNPAEDVVQPSSLVPAAESRNTNAAAEVPNAADLGSAAHVASPIKFSQQLTFGLSASKVHGLDREGAATLKLRKELEDLKMELTTEKSNRMVAEQLLSIVQQDLAEQQLRVSVETTARVKVENELVFVKTDLKHTERLLQEREDSLEELRQELKMANSLVERMEEYSQAVKYSTGGVDHFLDMKLSVGRVSEAEKKLKVCQQELLHSQEEVQRLLDKMEELTQERGEMVSHRVHSRLLKIADERADEAEKRVHELEAEVELLRGQVERTKQTSIPEETKPLSLFSTSLAVSRPLFSSPYSCSALLSASAPHSSVPSLDSFKFVSPYQADEFEHHTTKGGSEVAGLPVGLQMSEQQREAGGLPSAPGAGLSVAIERLYHGVEDDGTGQLGAGPIGERLGGKDAGVEDRAGMDVVLETGSGEVTTGGVLLPSGELPDLDLLGEEGGKLESKAGARKEKKSWHTVSILRVTGDSDGQDDDDDDDDSSDWGTSSEEGGEGEGGMAPVSLPQFEGLVPQEDGSSESLMPETRRPPPIKPKPPHLQFWQANADDRADVIYYETPSSFDKPPSQPGLRRFPFFPKPLGPRGRRLPARYQLLQLPVLELPAVA